VGYHEGHLPWEGQVIINPGCHFLLFLLLVVVVINSLSKESICKVYLGQYSVFGDDLKGINVPSVLESSPSFSASSSSKQTYIFSANKNEQLLNE
jgi:hypothetical protein